MIYLSLNGRVSDQMIWGRWRKMLTELNNLLTRHLNLIVPYSQKIWRGIKFGSFRRNCQIKIRQNLYCVHVCMAILFQTANTNRQI